MAAPNTAPIYVFTPNVGLVVLATANANRDGTTGAYTTLYTAGAQGATINRVTFRSMAAVGASTAMVCRLWWTSGATTVLVDETALATATSSTTAVGGFGSFTLKTGIQMKAGDILKVTQTVAESVGYCADQGGDF